MTTLSTLIGPAGSSLGLGEAAGLPKPSLIQRLGGVFRRPVGPAAKRPAPAASPEDVAAMEALQQVLDDASVPAAAHAFEHLHREADANDLSDSVDETKSEFGPGGPLLPPQPPRRRLLWGGPARRDAAMDEVRQGMGALASLLTGIQTHMEQQGARQQELVASQQELIACLSHLPASSAAHLEALAAHGDASVARNGVLQALRDQLAAGATAQAEALALQTQSLHALREQIAQGTVAQGQSLAVQNRSLEAIRDQIAQGAANQSRLCVALERLGGLQESAGAALSSIGRRIDGMDARDASFVASLEKVSDAMQTVSRASETSAVVLDRVQGNLAAREEGIHKTLDRHQSKFNALMAVAIAVSAAAMAVVAGVGYMVLTKVQ